VDKRKLNVGGVLLLAAVLAACSAEGSPSQSAQESEMPMASGDMGMDIGALGEQGEAASADRTVQITANDQLAFDPDAVDVRIGETVTFEIANTGTVDHEFVLGSADFQQQHEEEMQGGEMEMGGEPNELEVPAGETTSMTWRFTEAGTTEFGCHEPGHFAAGMVGDISVTE
jgi:uncharacterized cupredoxin-like copper-binding protein